MFISETRQNGISTSILQCDRCGGQFHATSSKRKAFNWPWITHTCSACAKEIAKVKKIEGKILKDLAGAEWIAKFHEQRTIDFEAMPLSEFKNLRKKCIHKSPTWHGRQSSEYYIVVKDGMFGYARKSNHWGWFSTSKYDDEGEKYYESHEWNLKRGTVRKDGKIANTSQVGIVWFTAEQMKDFLK